MRPSFQEKLPRRRVQKQLSHTRIDTHSKNVQAGTQTPQGTARWSVLGGCPMSVSVHADWKAASKAAPSIWEQ